MLTNPNYVDPASLLSRDQTADKNAVKAIIAGWSNSQPTITTAGIVNAWLASLSEADITAIQTAYPSGMGFYIEYLLEPIVAVDAAVGATVLSVDYALPVAGKGLTLAGATVLAVASVDTTANTITLASPLKAMIAAGTRLVAVG